MSKFQLQSFENYVSLISGILINAHFEAKKWTPKLPKDVWEESFYSNNTFKKADKTWLDSTQKTIDYELDFIPSIKQLVIIDRNDRVYSYVISRLMVLRAEINAFERKYDMFHSDIMAKNHWFIFLNNDVNRVLQTVRDLNPENFRSVDKGKAPVLVNGNLSIPQIALLQYFKYKFEKGDRIMKSNAAGFLIEHGHSENSYAKLVSAFNGMNKENERFRIDVDERGFTKRIEDYEIIKDHFKTKYENYNAMASYQAIVSELGRMIQVQSDGGWPIK